MMNINNFLLYFCAFLISLVQVDCSCYFPTEFQGEYETQASVRRKVDHWDYKSVVVFYNSISLWGQCHRRFGSNVILMDVSGGIKCFKCFKFVLRSANVLQTFSSVFNKCYTSEKRAIMDCPTNFSNNRTRIKELLLVRTKGVVGGLSVSPVYCPINGAYSFTYSLNDGTENALECSSNASELSDCPYGFNLNLKFKKCSFGSMELSFHCLGDWESDRRVGERHIALMDTQASTLNESNFRPRYRCALYKTDEKTGEINLALSSDSTCTNDLETPHKGYETLHLVPLQKGFNSRDYRGPSRGECFFPNFAQGIWENLNVERNVILMKDEKEFKTYTARCVLKSRIYEEKYVVFAKSHCGEEQYKCIWLKNRGKNALEYKLGSRVSTSAFEDLCADLNFHNESWRTQGRMSVTDPTPYPIVGEYAGVIPETEGLCAMLYSDCNNPEIMFYTILNCFNQSEVFEEREYRCLGQWVDERDGMIYTYTNRRDMIGYECFVAVKNSVSGDIYLREAGHNCERGHKPKTNGMKLTQVSKCYGKFYKKYEYSSSTKTSVEEDTDELFNSVNYYSSSSSFLPFSICLYLLFQMVQYWS